MTWVSPSTSYLSTNPLTTRMDSSCFVKLVQWGPGSSSHSNQSPAQLPSIQLLQPCRTVWRHEDPPKRHHTMKKWKQSQKAKDWLTFLCADHKKGTWIYFTLFGMSECMAKHSVQSRKMHLKLHFHSCFLIFIKGNLVNFMYISVNLFIVCS